MRNSNGPSRAVRENAKRRNSTSPVSSHFQISYEDTRDVDGRQAHVFGWFYRTLEGHFEQGQMHLGDTVRREDRRRPRSRARRRTR